MATAGGRAKARTSMITALALMSGPIMAWAAGCDDGAAMPPREDDDTPAVRSLTSADASAAVGCTVELTPTVDLPVPAALAAAGPWQLCGAYGTGRAHQVTSSYDSRRVAIVTDSGQAWVLAAGSFELLGVFAHGEGAISFAGLSPDGKLLATVDDVAGRVAIWNVPKHKLLRAMSRPPAAPSYYGLGAVTFSHDGSRLAVVSVSHIDVFDTQTGAPLAISSRGDLGGAMSVAFAANDTRLVLGRFRYWGNGPYAGWAGADVVDAATGDNQVSLAKEFYIDLPSIAVSGNGNLIAVGATAPSRSITFFDPVTGQATRDLPVTDAGVVLALDLNGTHVATLDAWSGGSSNPTMLSVREVATGTIVQTVSVPARTVYQNDRLFAVTPDLSGLLVGDVAPAVLTRIQMKNGRTHSVACGAGHFEDVVGLALSLDGATLVSTGNGNDGRRLAWAVATGAPVATVPPPEQLRSPSATSPDGTLQAVPQDESPNFELRNTATGEVVRTFGPQPSRPRAFDFAPDGAVIASSSERDPADRRAVPVANVWNVATGALEQSLPILTTFPETDAQAVLFGDVNHLFVAGYGTTARWCRGSAP